MSIRFLFFAVCLTLTGCAVDAAEAGVVFGNDGLAGGLRWDAAPRMIESNERSLDGGLRYSLQGGSFEAYRDLFHWVATPSTTDFQTAVEQAFAAWTAVDPATGLHTDISFVADLSTPVAGAGTFSGHDANGAEIDLFGLDSGETRLHAVTSFDAVGDVVTLTSGTANYARSTAISGVDVTVNNNAAAVYGLDQFRRLLTHEIGHALGLNDLEAAAAAPKFIDDNYDGSTSQSVVDTLTNSWALRVDPLNPADSPLGLYVVPDADPGIDSPGVDLLMESNGTGIGPANPVTSLVPLTDDEFGTRQFLYPSLVRDIAVTGDYNGDGLVDAADYTVWRDTQGQTVFWHGDGADGDQSGEIDLGDYEYWKLHFGDVVSMIQLAPPSSAPEPATICLAAISSAAFLAARSRPAIQKIDGL